MSGEITLSEPSTGLTPGGAMSRAGTRESTISVRVLLELVQAVEHAGVPRAELLRRASVPASLLEAPDARVSRAELYTLCEHALDVTRDLAFGLHWAHRLSDRAFVPITQLVAHAKTLRQGLELLAQYSKILADQTDYQVFERDGSIALVMLPLRGESERLQRMSAELVIGGFWRLGRSFAETGEIGVASFAFAPPPYVDEYIRFFDGAVRFEAPFTGIVFDRALLETPSRTQDEDVRQALEAVAERRLLKITQRVPFAMRARDFLVREGWPHKTDMQSVARALDLSVRSLRRRLDEEGRSYGEVLNEALAIVAKDLLRDRRRTVPEIAYAMGFSDASAFYRAFKRWTGTTPTEHREAALK